MALLVAQTRIESGVHSSLEVALGGVLGTLTTLRCSNWQDERPRREGGAAAARAYAPYSNYFVGAVVRARDGREFDGRERRERRLSARGVRREERDRRRRHGGLRPGDSRRSASPRRRAAAAGSGCTSSASTRSATEPQDGEIRTTTPAQLLPDTWELP
jgi:hypothetical protein